MGQKKERKKEELNIPTMILCIIGIVLTVFGFLLLKNDNFKLNVISAEGTVTSVQTKTNADGVETIVFQDNKIIKTYAGDKTIKITTTFTSNGYNSEVQ